MATNANVLWLAIYGRVVLALLVFGIVIVIVAVMLQSMRPRDSDFIYIQRHTESIGRRCVRVVRTSNFLRVPLGGLFSLSNISRIYRVTTELRGGGTRVVYYASDPLSGQWKVRLAKQWTTT
jgi:hypothetical protein